MTNPGGDSSETPASDSGSEASEPSAGGYESPPIEQSQRQADAGEQSPQHAQPTEQFTPPGQPTEQFTPPGYASPSSGYEAPSGYQPPTAYQPPTDYQQAGYPPPGYQPPYPPPPSYPDPGAQQQGYPPPYPDPSAYGAQPNYGAQSYPPPPPPQYGGAPGYPPPSSYPAAGYPRGYSPGYAQPQPETNQMAIWSLVASLIGILCTLSSLVGIALGVIALNQIKENRQGGHGLAIAGIGVGIATLIISIIWTAFAFST